MKKLISLFSLLALVACGGSRIITPEEHAAQVSCKEDKFDKTKWCQSQFIYVGGFNGGTHGRFALDANQKGAVPQMIIADCDATFLFVDSAKDIDGKWLKAKNNSFDSHGNMVCENFTIQISMAYLKKYKDSGINIKFYGRHGTRENATITFSPEYVQGFLKFLAENNLPK